jgi:hypothetical protein
MLAEVDGDGNNGKQERREKKGTQVFSDDIAIKDGQGIPAFEMQT